MLPWNASRTVQISCQPFVQNFIDKGTLSRSGDSGHAGHDTEREIHVDIFQIVLIGTSYLYILLPGSFLRGEKLDYPLTNVTQRIYKWNPDIDSHLRINAYPNGGDPDFMEDWTDEIKADMDIENGTSDHNPSTEVVEKNVLAGAGVLSLIHI